MNYQDIHLEDKSLWNQLQTAWEQSDYTTAFNVLKNINVLDKQLNAEAINAMTSALSVLQSQNDPTFKVDKIVVSTEPPADLADGKIYFHLIGRADDYSQSDSYFIKILQKDGASYIDLNPYMYATNMQIPTALEDGGRYNSLDELMYDLAKFFSIT